MPADKYVRTVSVNEGQCFQVIAAGPASDMLQKDFPALAFEKLECGIGPADILSVTIAVHSHHWLERSNRIGKLNPASEIPGMPKLVNRSKEFLEFRAEHPVRI